MIAAQVDGGADLATLVTDLLGHLRALFLCQQLGEPPEEVAATDDERARPLTQADRLQPATVHRLVDLLRDANDQVREGADPRLPLELALVRSAGPPVSSSYRPWSSASPVWRREAPLRHPPL